MQILIGCAKDMSVNKDCIVPATTMPRFQSQADRNALQMMAYTPDELRTMLKLSPHLAHEVWLRYRHFHSSDNLQPAVHAYTGVVFRHIGLELFSDSDYAYLQEHLWITSFLYGLLRPLDVINPYRLEGKTVLPENGKSMFAYWKPLLTDVLIESIKADGGVLVDLASNEMRGFFDWKRIEREVTVIRPDFLMDRNGTVKNVTVYAKMCRGAMTGFIVRNRITDICQLKTFEYEGFRYRGDGRNEYNPVFISE